MDDADFEDGDLDDDLDDSEEVEEIDDDEDEDGEWIVDPLHPEFEIFVQDEDDDE